MVRTRAAAPRLPAAVDGELLVADASLAETSLDAFLAVLIDAKLRPCAVLFGSAELRAWDTTATDLPVLASERSVGWLADSAVAYLDDERGRLERFAADLRLAAAEAALADPSVGAPSGLVAARIRRGVAVSADGELRAVSPRPAGRALAARFAAMHARLLAGGPASMRGEDRSGADLRAVTRQARDGLWLLEQPIRPGASVWLFDDLPFARLDEVAAEALAITLRALLRRPPAPLSAPGSRSPAASPPSRSDDPLLRTLLAVAGTNGRVAPAARLLGVHRNTVLYRLRRARAEQGIDPRRPEDALRLLREARRGQPR
ncbi:MAG: helix-turn-helix domain-containing protein [Candidatus Limnocylindria bacterium]